MGGVEEEEEVEGESVPNIFSSATSHFRSVSSGTLKLKNVRGGAWVNAYTEHIRTSTSPAPSSQHSHLCKA